MYFKVRRALHRKRLESCWPVSGPQVLLDFISINCVGVLAGFGAALRWPMERLHSRQSHRE